MDYSFFALGPQPPFWYFSRPPTPAHTHSDASEAFRNSPPDAFEQFTQFDTYAQFAAGQSLPRESSPIPNYKLPLNHLNANGISIDNRPNNLPEPAEENAQHSNSYNNRSNLTPTHSRRKAQNRAAQRAFRERKEHRLKELEAKLATFQKDAAVYSEENERLKRDLQKAATENETLRATFERLLTASAAWDCMIRHPLYEKDLVDIGFVSERLKYKAKWDGPGPVFQESDLIQAIESSVTTGATSRRQEVA